MDSIKIDWSKPIEAADGTPLVLAATGFNGPNPDEDGDHWVLTEGEAETGCNVKCVAPDGFHYSIGPVRNRREAPTRTALEQRMELAIRRHVAGKPYLFDDDEGPNISIEAEFRAIVQELEPVDEDLLEAREIMADLYPDTADKIRNGDWDNNAVRDCLQGLRRGRVLERGE